MSEQLQFVDISGCWWECTAGHRNELTMWASAQPVSWAKCVGCRDGTYWRIEPNEGDNGE